MKPSFLVTLYYALASIIGLVLTVIGASMLVNLLLTTYIIYIPKSPNMPPEPYMSSPTQVKQLEERSAADLTEEDKQALAEWKISYERWQKEQASYDYESVSRKNQLATSISMLVVGLPVLFFHQRELRKKN